MKKTRIFACLAALLLCFQTGISLTVNASEEIQETVSYHQEEIGAVRNRIRDFIDENQIAHVSCREDENGILFVWAVTPQNEAYVWKEISAEVVSVRAFCEEQGFTENYDIRFTAEENGQQKVCKAITDFAAENQLNFISCGIDSEGSVYVTASIEYIWEAYLEQLAVTKEFCEEQGFTEKYRFVFEQNLTDNMAAVIMAGDVTLNHKIDILDVITLNQAILGKKKLNTVQELAADANKDDKIDAADSLIIMKMIVGLTA